MTPITDEELSRIEVLRKKFDDALAAWKNTDDGVDYFLASRDFTEVENDYLSACAQALPRLIAELRQLRAIAAAEPVVLVGSRELPRVVQVGGR